MATRLSKSVLLTALLIPVLLACTDPSENQQLEKLQWLRTADPVVTFKKDLKVSRIRFYQYHGFASVIPVVGNDPCYRWAEVTLIEGTSDMIINGEHQYLNERARVFATEYNRLMKDHIDRAGLRSCPPKEG